LSSQITFIGAGNMATSLIRGLIASGHDAAAIRASDPAPEQLRKIAELGIATSGDNNAQLRGADVVILAVKPQVMASVAGGLTELGADQLLVSIAAGVPMSSLAGWTSIEQPIVRCMPNTPALLGAGVTALCANGRVSPAQKELAESVLATAGRTLWVSPEDQLDAVTAVSGSGPAYFFYLMEAMIEAGQALGLSAETAATLTLETARGAALMALEGPPPAQLRANVTSPGGTTQAALEVLEAADCRGIINAAVAAAADRSRELAIEFGR
jgi:pyrroline-5-carboxylate reductase